VFLLGISGEKRESLAKLCKMRILCGKFLSDKVAVEGLVQNSLDERRAFILRVKVV
jgi:hypothetical protein